MSTPFGNSSSSGWMTKLFDLKTRFRKSWIETNLLQNNPEKKPLCRPFVIGTSMDASMNAMRASITAGL